MEETKNTLLETEKTLSEEEKWFTCPRSGFLKNVPTLYRHVIKNKGFIDLYPYNNNKEEYTKIAVDFNELKGTSLIITSDYR